MFFPLKFMFMANTNSFKHTKTTLIREMEKFKLCIFITISSAMEMQFISL